MAEGGGASRKDADEQRARAVLRTCLVLVGREQPDAARQFATDWMDRIGKGRADGWMKKTVEYFAGRADAAAVLAEVPNDRSDRALVNRMAALYYLGMFALVNGNLDEAKRLLTDAVRDMPHQAAYLSFPFSTEYESALVELARL